MSIETIQNFLTLPELPDIISYLIIFVIFISELFLKKFVQRDNKNTIYKIEAKTKDLDKAITDFEKEKKTVEKEIKQIRKEFKAIKDAIKQEANNSRELVANGTANEISKMLDSEFQDVEEENLNE